MMKIIYKLINFIRKLFYKPKSNYGITPEWIQAFLEKHKNDDNDDFL